MNLRLQVIADIHEERFKIGNGSQVIVDTICTRQKSCGCCSQNGKLREHMRHISSLHHNEEHITDHAGNADGFNQKTRCGIIQVILLHGIDITGTALSVSVDEIILFCGDLDLLDSGNGFIDPFVQAAVIILIILSGPDHNRLDNIFDDQQYRNQKHRNECGHLYILNQQNRNQTYEYDHFTDQLQAAEDQAVHVVDIRSNITLNDRSIGIQIIFIRAFHEVDHHTLGRCKLIGIDKPQLQHIHEVKENILDNKNQNQRHHDHCRKLCGICHMKSVIDHAHVFTGLHCRRINDNRHNRDDQGDSKGFQNTSDQHHEYNSYHLALLLFIQQHHHLFINLSHTFFLFPGRFTP